MDLRKSAQKIAERGRFGDNTLVHMNTAEVAGLASLMPGGKLPINPDTGMPEAFFFLPFLASLGAAAAPAAAAALPAAATAAGTGLAAGLGAGATAAGLGAAAAPAAAGLAAAAPAATGAAAGLAGTGATGGLASLAAPTALGVDTMTTGAIGAGSAAAPSLAAVPGTALGTGTFSGAMPSAIGNSVTGFGAGAGAAPAAAVPTATHLGGVPLASSTAAPATAASETAAAAASPATAAGGVAGQGSLLTPLASGAEAAKTGIGSLLGGMDMSKMLQYGALAAMMMPQGGGGGDDDEDDGKGKTTETKSYDRGEQSAPDDGGVNGGLTDEWNYFPNARYYSGGGLVKGYAEGGLASLSEAQPAPTGEAASGSDGQLVEATVAAIQGQVEDPTPILQAFVQTFGQAALRDLIAKVSGGVGQEAAPVQGTPSDGMSDSIPATVGGQEPAALSEGEYVVPADVVSGLGNGDTTSGAEQLQGMVDRTRQMKNGGMVQPPAIDPRKAMPV